MAYTEDFKHILAKRNQINNANLFVFKNNTPRSMKVFPEEVSNVLLEKYFDTLTGIEVDGTAFHKAESKQAERDMKKNSILEKCAVPLLRLRTDGSGEKEKIRNALKRD